MTLPTDEPDAALRPDGKALAVDTGAGVAIWDLDPQRWAEAACLIAGRNLTRQEWDTYIGGEYHATSAQWPSGA